MTTQTEQRRARLTAASNVIMTRQRELYASRIPLGTVSLVAGYAGEGKSSWLVHVTALGSRGQLDGDLAGAAFSTIWTNIEDDPGRVQVPRLTAAGADLDQVMFLSIDSTVDEVTRETIPTLPLDIGAFRDALVQSGAKLLVLDPASSLMSGDLNKREDARRSLDALSGLAQELDVAIVLVMHLAKGRGRASEKISGSHALRDAVRSVLLVARDDETDQRIITVDKSNYGPHTGKSWAFAMLDTTVETPEGEVLHVGRVQDLGETDMTVDSIINRSDDDETDDRDDVDSWLTDLLSAGPMEAKQVYREGDSAGYSRDQLKRSKKRIRAEATHPEMKGPWFWQVPREQQGSKGSGHPDPRSLAPLNAPLGAEQRPSATEGAEGAGAPERDTFGTFVAPSTAERHLRVVDDWVDPGCCRHGVTIGGRCRTCGGVAA